MHVRSYGGSLCHGMHALLVIDTSAPGDSAEDLTNIVHDHSK